MISTEQLSLLKRKFPNYGKQGNEYKVICPRCHPHATDGHGLKLYINFKRGVFHCFVCDWAGPIRLLFPMTSFTVPVVHHETIIPIEVLPDSAIEAIPDGSIEFKYLPNQHPAVQYLIKRRLSIETLPSQPYYTSDFIRQGRSFGSRIVFPIYSDNQYQGFQARSLQEDHPIKYVSALGFKKSKTLYNWDRAKQGKQIVITEGIFDANRVGISGVASFGKSLSEVQMLLLRESKATRIILLYDRDALKASKIMAHELARRHSNIWYGILPKKDPDEMDEQILHSFLAAGLSPFNSTGLQRAF